MCILENYLRYSSQFEEVPQKLDTSYMDDSDASDSETDSDDETEKFSRPPRVSSSSEESYEIEYSSESDEGSSFGSEVETDFTDEEGEENKRDGTGEEKSLAELNRKMWMGRTWLYQTMLLVLQNPLAII